MPLESPDQQHWQAAVGYVELGMFAEADSELDKIDPFYRALPRSSRCEARHLPWIEKVGVDAAVAKQLKEFEPDNVQWTISLAYATRRAYSIDTPMEILLNAQAKFPKEAAIPYNLACYYCQRGEMETAKRF